MRDYCYVAVESRLGVLVLRVFSPSKACITLDEPSSKRVVGVGLDPKLPKPRSLRCT